jgi:glycosyltransferase involved in cell wall biosynthesis
MTTVLEHWGGLEKYLSETSSYLTKNRNVEASVITMSNDYTQKIINLLSIFYMKKIDIKHSFKRTYEQVVKFTAPAKYIKTSAIKDLRKELKGYDIVYSKNELIEAFLLKFFVGYKNIPPVIFGCHTPLKYSSPSGLHQKIHNFLYTGFIYKFLASGVDTFHVINQYEFDNCKALFPNKKVVKILNPFDSKKFLETASKPFKTYEIDAKKINVLWVGRFTQQKGTSKLAEIIDLVNNNPAISKMVQWNIVGEGEDKDVIETLAKRNNNIKLFGFVQPEDIPSIYVNSQLFISTSLWEGYPYNLLEATAAKLSIVATDIPGNNDILAHYRNGILVRDNDAFANEIMSFAREGQFSSMDRDASSQLDTEPEIIYNQLEKMFISI